MTGKETDKDRFQQRILIHQNLCLSSRVTELRQELAKIKVQLQTVRKEQNDSGRKQERERMEQKIQQLADENNLLKQRITLLNNYRSEPMEQVIQKGQHLCYCGGLLIQYYQNKIQQLILVQKQHTQILLAKPAQQKSTQILTPEDRDSHLQQGKVQNKREQQLERQNQQLKKQLAKCEKKIQKCRLTHHYNLDYILKSPQYAELKMSCNNLLLFCSSIISKQNYVFKKYDSRDKDRQLRFQSLYKKVKSPFANLKATDVAMKGQTFTLLTEVKTKYEEINKKVQILSAKLRSFNKRYSQMGKLSDSLNKIEPNSYQQIQVGIMIDIHNIISQWINNQLFKDFLQHNQIKQKHVERSWRRYKDVVRVTFDDNLDLRRQVLCLHQKLMKGQVVAEVKQEFQEMIEGIKKLDNSYKMVQSSIMDAQFRATASLAQEGFRFQRQSLRRQQLQLTLAQLEKKLPQCRKIVSQSTSLTAKIQQEKLQLKQKEGEITGQIITLKAELTQKDKIIEIHKANHQKSIQDISKLNKQIDRLASLHHRMVPEQVQSSEGDSLREEIEVLYKKITCLCGRSREARKVLSSCGHIFCKQCVEKNLLKGRKRQCPMCGTRFSESQVVSFILN